MVIELPAGLLLRVWHPRYVIGCAAAAFGVFSCCVAVSKSYVSVMVLRVLIGLSEAFVNNAFIYISLWYGSDELALRTGKSSQAMRRSTSYNLTHGCKLLSMA